MLVEKSNNPSAELLCVLLVLFFRQFAQIFKQQIFVLTDIECGTFLRAETCVLKGSDRLVPQILKIDFIFPSNDLPLIQFNINITKM